MLKKERFTSTESAYDAVKNAGYSVAEFKDWLRTGHVNTDPTRLCAVDVCNNASQFILYKEGLKTLVIDETNFDQYFFDCYKHAPRPGQILACYDAEADLVDGNLKRDIIHLLMTKNRAGQITVRLLQKLAGATTDSAVKVIKEIVSDLMSGMSTEVVANKPYNFQCQYFYYTYRECMPKGDPHWWSTALVDVKSFGLDEYLESRPPLLP
jgi:hypothetical protein